MGQVRLEVCLSCVGVTDAGTSCAGLGVEGPEHLAQVCVGRHVAPGDACEAVERQPWKLIPVGGVGIPSSSAPACSRPHPAPAPPG